MKKPAVIAIAIGGLVLVAVVYSFFIRKASQKVGEKMLENMVESQTGAQVDINTGLSGQVNIKTADGQTQYSAGGTAAIPDNFPRELLIIDDARVVISSTTPDMSSITFYTNDDSATVYNKYVTALKAADWETGMQIDTGKGKVLSMTKGSEAVVITIGENESKDEEGKSTVNLSWTKDNQ